MSDSLWDQKRVDRYVKLYGDPREMAGSQANLCRDVATLITGTSILDVGCGIGHLIPFIEGRNYTGFDYSFAMLEKLTDFFPSIHVIQGDATAPYKEFQNEMSYNILEPVETAVSVSLIIHLPDLEGVKQLLVNMWNTATKEIIFGVETMGDNTVTRASGLTIRNIAVPHVIDLLGELDIPKRQVAWQHQQMTYKNQTIVHPLKANPMAMTPPQLFQRTTLFHVFKEHVFKD